MLKLGVASSSCADDNFLQHSKDTRFLKCKMSMILVSFSQILSKGGGNGRGLAPTFIFTRLHLPGHCLSPIVSQVYAVCFLYYYILHKLYTPTLFVPYIEQTRIPKLNCFIRIPAFSACFSVFVLYMSCNMPCCVMFYLYF